MAPVERTSSGGGKRRRRRGPEPSGDSVVKNKHAKRAPYVVPASDGVFDVIILGAGLAGNAQCRHLLLQDPTLRIAMIDPTDETQRTLKVGESMIEVATFFMCHDLKLYDYMIDNHLPKYGLSYHWAKDPTRTNSTRDFYHVWANRNPQLESKHFKRSKWERDVLMMNKDDGVHFFHGRVCRDVKIAAQANRAGGEAFEREEAAHLHTVHVRMNDAYVRDPNDDGAERLALRGRYVVDCTGRRHILGRQLNNITWDKKDVLGIDTGAFWVRVRGFDRTIFTEDLPSNLNSGSVYYTTNHWMGDGYWMWMIPIERDPLELSIGVTYHREKIPSAKLNTLEKFLAFIAVNQQLLSRLIASGEVLDHHHLHRIPFKSKCIMSQDRWAVVGDACAFFDAFYSTGTTMMALHVTSITKIILDIVGAARMKRSGGESTTEFVSRRDALLARAGKKTHLYNNLQLRIVDMFNTLVCQFPKTCGNASVMSARIYFDFLGYFGMMLPMYCGKFHLSLTHARFAAKFMEFAVPFMYETYSLIESMAVEGKNVGFWDVGRANQLLYSTYSPTDMVGEWIPNGQFEPRQLDVYDNYKHFMFHMLQFYTQLQYRAYGVRGILAPKTLIRMAEMGSGAAAFNVQSFLHRWTRPAEKEKNSTDEEMRRELKSYNASKAVRLLEW